MPEKDALGSFDFDQVTPPSLYLKFEAGKPLTLRVLTIDPVVFESEFEDKTSGEVTINTRFAFIVYNFTQDKAQILQASPTMSRKFGELHVDTDFGANIRNIDIKISPTGEKLERRYDIQVLPQARTMTPEQVKEASTIDLDSQVAKGKSVSRAMRMSKYEAKKAAEPISQEPMPTPPVDLGDKPINLDDIPF